MGFICAVQPADGVVKRKLWTAMQTDIFTINIDDTQDIRLYYYHPQSGVNWGLDLAGSDIVQDIRTPLVLFLNDYPGGDFEAEGNLFPELAKVYTEMGLPCLALEYRGCGLTSQYAGHFSFKSAMRDIEVALLWAMTEKEFAAFLPVTAGVSALVAMQFFKKYKLKYVAREHNYADKKTLQEALEQNQEDFCPKKQDVSMLNNLRLVGTLMFWPWLDRDSNALVQYYRQAMGLDVDTPTAKEKLLVSDDIYSDVSVRIAGKECKVGLKFLQQLEQTNPLTLFETVTCPTLIQHGTLDEFSAPIDLQMLSQHVNTAYLDYQSYQGHGNGLGAEAIRPIIKSVTKDFIKRFA